MMLTRKTGGHAVPQGRLARVLNGVQAKTMDRRAFLKRSGVTLGAGAASLTVASQLPPSMMRRWWQPGRVVSATRVSTGLSCHATTATTATVISCRDGLTSNASVSV